jgi:hypothetical protein
MIKERSLLKLILLSMITCGIYDIIFWWGYVKDINTICEGDGKKSPNYLVVILLNIVTFGIYDLYWNYTQGNRLQQAAPNYGLVISKGGSAVLAWNLLGSLVAAISSLISPFIKDSGTGTVLASGSLPVTSMMVMLAFSLVSVIFVAISWSILINNLNALGAAYNARPEKSKQLIQE